MKEWVIRYSRHHAPYEYKCKTREEALKMAAYMTEDGQGYVKEIVGPTGEIIDLDGVWEYIWEQGET